MSSISFIGLGNMGGPMAANLVRAGHRVRGFDLSQDCIDRARRHNVEIASSLGQAVDGVDCVMTMLPAGRHVVEVWSEIVGQATKDALLIDCSTIDVDSAKRVHALAQKHELASADAPVSGGTVGAKGATLTFMVGAEPQAYDRARPLLEAMGQRVVNCGGPGAGQAAKICNNMILGITMIGISEAFVLGERLGLTHQALFDVASTSSGSCWALTTHCPVPGPVPTSAANNDYTPGFATELMLKDLRLAQQASLSTGASTPLGATAAALYGMFQAAGHGSEDYSAVVNFLRGRKGTAQ